MLMPQQHVFWSPTFNHKFKTVSLALYAACTEFQYVTVITNVAVIKSNVCTKLQKYDFICHQILTTVEKQMRKKCLNQYNMLVVGNPTKESVEDE